jgi:GR25 family glycosyltransferase involved in LPS biosynthesis
MNGCFINLQRSGDRRMAMEAQLRALGIEGVARFEAIDAATLPAAPADAATSAGERACFLSHARALYLPHYTSMSGGGTCACGTKKTRKKNCR